MRSFNRIRRLVKPVLGLLTGSRSLAKRPQARLALEGLETRELLSCSAMIDLDGVLRVNCDNTSNLINVVHDEAPQVTRLLGAVSASFRDADFVALEINFGTANDQTQIVSAAPDRPITVNNRGGADRWLVNGFASQDRIQTPITFNGTSGASLLSIDASRDPAARQLVLSSFDTENGTYGYVSGFPGDIAYQFDAVRQVNVSTGAGDDSVCVLDVGEGFETRIGTGGGNDTLHVAGFRERSTLIVDLGDGDDTARLGDFANTLSPFLSPPSINGGSGVNSLHLVDSGRTESATYTFDNGYVQLRSDSQDSTIVYFSQMSDIVIYPGLKYEIQWLYMEYNLVVSSDTPPECGCGFQGAPSPGGSSRDLIFQAEGGRVADNALLDTLVRAARKSAQPVTAWDLGLIL